MGINLTIDVAGYLPRVLRIGSKCQETRDTVTIALKATADSALPKVLPGQFNMLGLPGIGEIPLSVSGVSGGLIWHHTIRAVGPVSKAISELKVGASVSCRGPFGSAWPLAQAQNKSVIVIAGGLGIAPLRLVVHHLMNHHQQFRDVYVLIGARSAEDIPFAAEISGWLQQSSHNPERTICVTVDRPDPTWRGKVGMVTSLLPQALSDPKETVAFVCGPEVMMRHVARDLQDLGLRKERIFLSLERNMKCALRLCGHCQLGRVFICRDGPIFSWANIEDLLSVKEL